MKECIVEWDIVKGLLSKKEFELFKCKLVGGSRTIKMLLIDNLVDVVVEDEFGINKVITSSSREDALATCVMSVSYLSKQRLAGIVEELKDIYGRLALFGYNRTKEGRRLSDIAISEEFTKCEEADIIAAFMIYIRTHFTRQIKESKNYIEKYKFNNETISNIESICRGLNTTGDINLITSTVEFNKISIGFLSNDKRAVSVYVIVDECDEVLLWSDTMKLVPGINMLTNDNKLKLLDNIRRLFGNEFVMWAAMRHLSDGYIKELSAYYSNEYIYNVKGRLIASVLGCLQKEVERFCYHPIVN